MGGLLHSLKHAPSIAAWRRSCARDPLTSTAGLLVWGVTVWWIIPAFSDEPGSIISRILEARLSIVGIQVTLVLLALLLAGGVFGCWSWITRAAAYAGFVWWSLVWVIAAIQQFKSTSTGSYGVILALAVIYLYRAALRPDACQAVTQ